MPGKTIIVETLRELINQLKTERCVRTHVRVSSHNIRSMCVIEGKQMTPQLPQNGCNNICQKKSKCSN